MIHFHMGRLAAQAEDLEKRLSRLESQVGELQTLIKRGGLLILLWSVALYANVAADEKAELAVMLLQRVLQKQ